MAQEYLVITIVHGICHGHGVHHVRVVTVVQSIDLEIDKGDCTNSEH